MNPKEIPCYQCFAPSMVLCTSCLRPFCTLHATFLLRVGYRCQDCQPGGSLFSNFLSQAQRPTKDTRAEAVQNRRARRNR